MAKPKTVAAKIPTKTVASVKPSTRPHTKIRDEFDALLHDRAKGPPGHHQDTKQLRKLSRKYTPIYSLRLFDTRFYLSEVRQIPELRFFVGYVVQQQPNGQYRIYARIFYKDLSLAWRVASHLVSSQGEFWIGKGAVRTVYKDGYEHTVSVESTTDLPLELQTAFEALNRRAQNIRNDETALYRVLRVSKRSRLAPYSDFTKPRLHAATNRSNLIHRGRPIARFTRKQDPSSLRFEPGYAPDFAQGIIERSTSKSTLYHGRIRRFRILAHNRKVQYLFFAGQKHVWIVPPQALTTQLSTYGIRTIDVEADDDLFIPGYEYHYVDARVPASEHFSQIPKGFAGEPSAYNEDRADASAWLDQIPVIREFRQTVLRSRKQ